MRRKDTPKQEAKEEVKKELPPPTAKDDGAAKDIATALLAQSENTLEIIATLIKSQKVLDSHAIVMDSLIEAAREKAAPPRRVIHIRVTKFDNLGRPTDYTLTDA